MIDASGLNFTSILLSFNLLF